MNAPDPVRALVDRLVEGQSIEWDAAAIRDNAMLDGLHVLDEVRSAYRRIGHASAPPTPVLFHWGPLAVLDKVGAGASAEVYRAWDSGLATTVALKLLRPEAAAAGLRSEEFLREGRLLARIAHHNVLRVHGAAIHAGRPGLWNEWIDGRTLEAIVAADGPLSCAEVRHVGLELCAALGAIHAAGLVHGDVKASNVLRARGGRIVLVDLGAAGTPDALDGSLRTQATPAYLSPQARDGAPRSAADDLYALGVLLYFLLTGTYPTNERMDLRARLPDLDPRVAGVIERALAVDPAQRHAQAHAFADALRASVSNAPAPMRIRRGWLAAASIALIALGAWVVWPAPEGTAWSPQAALVSHDQAGVALRDGDALAVGDRLDLKLENDRPTWVYLLNEDETGSFHVLFPLAGLPHANPLPRGQTMLPGEQSGRALSWQVSSAGGREEFVLVLANAPLPGFEQRLAGFAAASIEAPQRGVAQVGSAPLTNVSLHGRHLNALLNEFAGELGDRRRVQVIAYRFNTRASR